MKFGEYPELELLTLELKENMTLLFILKNKNLFPKLQHIEAQLAPSCIDTKFLKLIEERNFIICLQYAWQIKYCGADSIKLDFDVVPGVQDMSERYLNIKRHLLEVKYLVYFDNDYVKLDQRMARFDQLANFLPNLSQIKFKSQEIKFENSTRIFLENKYGWKIVDDFAYEFSRVLTLRVLDQSVESLNHDYFISFFLIYLICQAVQTTL